MFNKLKENIKSIFEGNRCRFRNSCKLYKKGSGVCNDWLKRFPTYEEAYCGKYRSLDE